MWVNVYRHRDGWTQPISSVEFVSLAEADAFLIMSQDFIDSLYDSPEENEYLVCIEQETCAHQ